MVVVAVGSAGAWGVGFLVGYAILAIAAAGFALGAVQNAGRATGGTPDTTGPLDPYQVGYVHGGPSTAVMAAVAALHARKAVATLRGGRLTATGEAPATRVKPLEYAVLRSLRSPTTVGSLRSAPVVRDELRTVEQHLVARGLVPPAPIRRLLWTAAGVLAAVAVVGLAHLVVAPEGSLVATLAGFGVVAAVVLPQIRRLVRRTAAGEALLAGLRAENADLDPAHQDAWRPREPEPAATAVALFGAGAMPPGTPGWTGPAIRTGVDGSVTGGPGGPG